MKSLFIAPTALLALMLSSPAAVLDFSSFTHYASNTTTNTPAIARSFNESGLNKVDPNDPSTWLQSTGGWTQDFQASNLNAAGTTNNIIGWVAYNLGSIESSLDTFYIWNNSEGTAGNRDVQDYNIYYASNPAVTLSSNGDYDFTTTGWTKVNGSTLTMSQLTNTSGPQASIDLGGISAQYIAIEVVNNYSDASRWGIAEVALTQVPEPSAALLGALGALMLLRRRR